MDINNTFVREFHRTDGKILYIAQLEIGDVGCVVWDAALVLSHFLDTSYFVDEFGNNILDGKYVIELGSGTGLVGIQAAVNGATCVVTDLQEFVPLLDHNIDLNKSALKANIKAKCLKWGETVEEFLHPDIIFLADCIYYDEGIKPLFQTLCDLCGDQTIIYFCYEIRSTEHKKSVEEKFFKLIKSSFIMKQIPMDCHSPDYRCEEIVIYKFSKRIASAL